MAHGLKKATDMVYVGKTPWHGLGVRLDSSPTVQEALKAAHLDWTAERRQLAFFEPVRQVYVDVAAHAITRSDTGAVLNQRALTLASSLTT